MDSSAQKSSRRWRIPRAEIMSSSVLIPGDQWHPLDGGPAPEYIPPLWDGPHVGLRLCEAFKTLAALPGGISLGGASGYWPEYTHDWNDLIAQEESDAQLKEEKATAHNRARVRPSAQEISRMEMAICWPGRYVPISSYAQIVQRVALYRSRDLDLQYAARRIRIGEKQMRARNRAGLDMIAAGLRRDAVRVF
jgi:hypothetical protein